MKRRNVAPFACHGDRGASRWSVLGRFIKPAAALNRFVKTHCLFKRRFCRYQLRRHRMGLSRALRELHVTLLISSYWGRPVPSPPNPGDRDPGNRHGTIREDDELVVEEEEEVDEEDEEEVEAK
ncbi:hypothetical protein DPEC_G00242540 [Dallia pectoralis]|uniref:Uncharacterized protein n=1 Tax=Dallia pectoralis TaxID=75939 RepID=A0ACC2FV63_DALPE|nr:hypothetical protein DPEC_G00242540 [Dallia pectoralis]